MVEFELNQFSLSGHGSGCLAGSERLTLHADVRFFNLTIKFQLPCTTKSAGLQLKSVPDL